MQDFVGKTLDSSWKQNNNIFAAQCWWHHIFCLTAMLQPHSSTFLTLKPQNNAQDVHYAARKQGSPFLSHWAWVMKAHVAWASGQLGFTRIMGTRAMQTGDPFSLSTCTVCLSPALSYHVHLNYPSVVSQERQPHYDTKEASQQGISSARLVIIQQKNQ